MTETWSRALNFEQIPLKEGPSPLGTRSGSVTILEECLVTEALGAEIELRKETCLQISKPIYASFDFATLFITSINKGLYV